jgi:AmmeMemoRadiSam system protein B/AmmeMemoRadiSam system protein A
VAPHAAPLYSGTVAAAAYRHLQLAGPERIFLLGFSHRDGPRGIAIPDVDAYRTPLGDAAVDRSTVRALCADARFQLVDERQLCDHSVEIQLPFLRRAAPAAAVIPLYVGYLEEEERRGAAEALARAWHPGDVLLASSDFTHYGRGFHYVPFPADRQVAARLRGLDRRAIEGASGIDSALFLESLRECGATVCGSLPISLLLRTLSLLDGEDIFQQELDYQTSGEITGNFSESVSYAALGYFHRNSYELDPAERRELLLSAQATLRHLRETGRREPIAPASLPALAMRAPVFVTLRDGERLIGCIGRLSHCPPLAEAVPQLTLAAALDDPRRAPGDGIPENGEIEISVLTPMKRVRGSEAIQIGRDGIYVECGVRQAVLLPQVAGPDWSAGKFLGVLLRKAGLDARACGAPETRLSVFQAQVFGVGFTAATLAGTVL